MLGFVTAQGSLEERDIALDCGTLIFDERAQFWWEILLEGVRVMLHGAFIASRAVFENVVLILGPDTRFKIDPALVQNTAFVQIVTRFASHF